jgi:ribonuclease T1
MRARRQHQQEVDLNNTGFTIRSLVVIAVSLLLGIAIFAFFTPSSPAREAPAKIDENAVILATDLPKEGQATLALIRKGGPFPYAKDGTVFSNRERALPKQPRGYYHEYTVKTPRERTRGAKRIICGGAKQLECFYTEDHYATFRKIKE